MSSDCIPYANSCNKLACVNITCVCWAFDCMGSWQQMNHFDIEILYDHSFIEVHFCSLFYNDGKFLHVAYFGKSPNACAIMWEQFILLML